MNRVAKQLFYGALYLAIFALILAGIYFLFLRPGPSCVNGRQDAGESGVDCGGVCQNICLSNTLRPITAINTYRFRPTPTQTAILVRLQNPNSELGARRFAYRLDLLDSGGQVIRSLPGTSFIYPSEVKYLVEFTGSSGLESFASIAVVIGEPEWVAAEDFTRSDIAVQDRRVEVAEKTITVTGRIVNKDTTNFPRVSILAIFYSAAGSQPVGVSPTEIDDFAANDARPFSINYPLSSIIDPQRTEIVVYARRP